MFTPEIQSLADRGRMSDQDVLGIAREIAQKPRLERISELTAAEAFALQCTLDLMSRPLLTHLGA